jgi:hypothetical protein
MAYENRLTAPFDPDGLTDLDLRDIDLDRRKRQCVCCGVHLINKRPGDSCKTDGAESARRKLQKITPGFPVVTVFRRCRTFGISHGSHLVFFYPPTHVFDWPTRRFR